MLEFGFKSDTGKVREMNQDSFFVMPNEKIYIVADGVGGHTAGELASRTAVSGVADQLKKEPLLPDDTDDEIKEKFTHVIFFVNNMIYQMSRSEAPLGMATTLLMMYICHDNAYIANIGDSRAYLMRNDDIMQVTEDHTYVNDLVKKGIITPEQAVNHPDRNMITRAVGAEETVKPDFFKFRVYPDDVILLCTDGLYNEVGEKEILKIVAEASNMREACDEMTRLANSRGGRDNITALTVKI